GKWRAADTHIKALDNKLLLGHVLHQRYMHPTDYRSRYSELRGWLKTYADHPGAKRLYRLAVKRRGKARYPKRPIPAARKRSAKSDVAEFKDSRSNRSVRRSIARAISRNTLTKSGERIFAEFNKGRLNHHDVGVLAEALARGWVAWGNPEKGLAAITKAADIARPARITTDWQAGLLAWQLGDHEAARHHFAAVADNTSYPKLSAAGGVWAARAAYRIAMPKDVSTLLRKGYEAAPDSFYGLVAARQLGIEIRRDWSPPEFSQVHWAEISSMAGVQRAVALSQVGQSDLADQELLYSWYRAEDDAYQALLALAYRLDLPQAQLRIAESAPEGQIAPLLNLYPIPSWQPRDGFQTDPAMLFALIRQESRFSSRARSRSGARGLMQVMPRTAGFISADRRLIRDRQNLLYDAEFNMSLGQRYVTYLKTHKSTDGDLLHMLAAYNGGPGNLSKWRRKFDDSDPLWFIEKIPLKETRGYVEEVSANYWIYRTAMGLETKTLDRVAAGLWPKLEPDSDAGIDMEDRPLFSEAQTRANRPKPAL
ncbi:MAG: transglycosylase SLT domain-containing protein, partial [Pseudomonadota bacterium]